MKNLKRRIRCWIKGHIWKNSRSASAAARTAKERCLRCNAIRTPPHHASYYGHASSLPRRRENHHG